MSDKELFEILKESQKAGAIAFMLREIAIRQQQIIVDTRNRIAMLEDKTVKAKGRKKKEFFFNERLLTDDEIVRLIDGEYIDSIGQLEKKVGAGKNQLRTDTTRKKDALQCLKGNRKKSSNNKKHKLL